MKKHGFTLAEVLITLGIIGVIAALTMPLFVQKTQTVKVGPTLGKAIVTFENGTKAMMIRSESDTLSGTYVCSAGGSACAPTDRILLTDTADADAKIFWTNLGDFVSGSMIDAPTNLPENLVTDGAKTGFLNANGVIYSLITGFPATPLKNDDMPSKTVIQEKLVIDINGLKEPNQPGKDQFYFYLMEDGTLRPYGSSDAQNILQGENITDTNSPWQTSCKVGEVPADAKFCAGHVVENNMKVEYK
ncbi:MAG: type II secretion system GspH family protein [bacterium]|nr:type II secretion system GspH family protein [bacterium]